MAANLKVFVCEFITGGGLYNAPLPESLAREGDAMLAALLADLLEVPGIELATTRDPRLPPLAFPIATHTPSHADAVWPLWQQCMDDADAVWPIAPESGGLLEKISAMAPSKLLGCPLSAIRIAASKRATALLLAEKGVPVVPTSLPGSTLSGTGAWVAKPDDGVGCEDARRFDNIETVQAWLQEGRLARHVVQPWLEGEPASISMLCRKGDAQLLSCNRQLIELADGAIRYRGSQLNGMARHWDAFAAMAALVAAAMPDLAGYVGVDVMVRDGHLTVLEINPRLTTSYAGLHRAIGVNPAGLVLDLHYNGRFIEARQLQRNMVEVRVDD